MLKWVGLVERMGSENWGKESRCLESGGGRVARMTDIMKGGCKKRDMERVTRLPIS